MKNKILVLRFGLDGAFFPFIKDEDLKSYYKTNNSRKSILFKILNKLNFYNLLAFIYFDSWKKELKKYDTVIFFDNGYATTIAKYCKKKNPSIKTIYYTWNRLNIMNEKQLKYKDIDEFWTYSEEDAKKYKINYNPCFYTNNVNLPSNKRKYDICFLGLNKNRKNIIDEVNSYFKQQSIKTNFVIIDNENNQISYQVYLNIISLSNAILDIVNDKNYGMTLRPLESIFLEKKLVTNYKDIKYYNFYDKENIFILGVDDMKNLKDFLKRPYKKLDNEVINYYDYENWKNRFIK